MSVDGSQGTKDRRDDQAPMDKPRGRRNLVVLLPLLVFGAIAATFGYALHQNQLGRDITEIPSVLIDKPAPQTVLPALAGLTGPDGTPVPGLDLTAPRDKPLVVNVFASWCGPCRQEHPLLMNLARDERVRVVAINYKDKPGNALGFLSSLGNPYDAVGVDEKGAATIDWGVYGVPETFLVSTEGTIVYKQTGPFDERNFREGLMPAIERLVGGAAAGDGATS